jgi:hypothetical protein
MDEDTHPDIVIELLDHDTPANDISEWLAVHNRGVDAGRKDVIAILSRLLGAGEHAEWLLARVLRELEAAPITG